MAIDLHASAWAGVGAANARVNHCAVGALKPYAEVCVSTHPIVPHCRRAAVALHWGS